MATTTRKAARAVSSGRPLMTWEEAAQRLGTSVRHLKRIVYDPAPGYAPVPIVKVGGRVRFNPDLVDEWLAESEWTVDRGG